MGRSLSPRGPTANRNWTDGPETGTSGTVRARLAGPSTGLYLRGMNDVRRARALRPWALISAAWVGPAVLAAVAAYLQGRIGWREPTDLKALLWEGGDWLLYGALTPLVFLLARRLPLRRGNLRRNIPIHFAAALVLCVLWAGSGLIYRHLLGLEPMGAPLRAMEGWFLITLPFGVAVYFAVLGVEHATVYYAEAREREVHAARLSSQLAEAPLADPGGALAAPWT